MDRWNQSGLDIVHFVCKVSSSFYLSDHQRRAGQVYRSSWRRKAWWERRGWWQRGRWQWQSWWGTFPWWRRHRQLLGDVSKLGLDVTDVGDGSKGAGDRLRETLGRSKEGSLPVLWQRFLKLISMWSWSRLKKKTPLFFIPCQAYFC